MIEMFWQLFRKKGREANHRRDELQLHPERFVVIPGTGKDKLAVLPVVRRSTGELFAEDLANPYVQVDEHPECFDFIKSTDKNNFPVTRVVRKATGDVALLKYHSKRTD